MKKTFTLKLFAILCCAALFTFSCKNDPSDLGLAPASPAKFKELRTQALKDLTQTASFKAEEGISFTSDKGTLLTIGPDCLRDDENNTVTGDVTLSFIEIYDRGNMVATNKPVMGKDGEGNLLPLVTGGQYNLEIKQDNKRLKSRCTFHVSIPTALTGGVDDEMILWKGEINEEGNLVWEDAGQRNGNVGPDDKGTSYNVWEGEFGWTNVDRFYSDPRPKTQIKVTVPSGYSNENSGVFLAYEGEPNVLAQLDVYNTADNYFTEHYGFIPIGMNLHVIFVSESNGSVVYHIKKVTIAANATIAINSDDLNTTTKNNLVSMINALN